MAKKTCSPHCFCARCIIKRYPNERALLAAGFADYGEATAAAKAAAPPAEVETKENYDPRPARLKAMVFAARLAVKAGKRKPRSYGRKWTGTPRRTVEDCAVRQEVRGILSRYRSLGEYRR